MSRSRCIFCSNGALRREVKVCSTAERANEPPRHVNKRPDIYIKLHKNLIMAVKHLYDVTINITDTWVRRNVFRNISTVQPRTNKMLFMRPALIFISFVCLFFREMKSLGDALRAKCAEVNVTNVTVWWTDVHPQPSEGLDAFFYLHVTAASWYKSSVIIKTWWEKFYCQKMKK